MLEDQVYLFIGFIALVIIGTVLAIVKVYGSHVLKTLGQLF